MSQNACDVHENERKVRFQARGLQPGVQYDFVLRGTAGHNQQPSWSEPYFSAGVCEDTMKTFLNGESEHELRARCEYLEGCITYDEAILRADKSSVTQLLPAEPSDQDGAGALLHDAGPNYGDAIRHMKYIRKRALREARLRRNGQIFKFWADREFVPCLVLACSSYSLFNFGKKEQDTVSNFRMPGATFAIDIGFGRTIYNEETKICGHRWGARRTLPCYM